MTNRAAGSPPLCRRTSSSFGSGVALGVSSGHSRPACSSSRAEASGGVQAATSCVGGEGEGAVRVCVGGGGIHRQAATARVRACVRMNMCVRASVRACVCACACLCASQRDQRRRDACREHPGFARTCVAAFGVGAMARPWPCPPHPTHLRCPLIPCPTTTVYCLPRAPPTCCAMTRRHTSVSSRSASSHTSRPSASSS